MRPRAMQNQLVEQAGGLAAYRAEHRRRRAKEDLSRGDWLLGAARRTLRAGDRRAHLSRAAQPVAQSLHIHHAASHITGRVSLLEGNLAELVLDTPLWLADNDRLVLRDNSARLTPAGARR